MLRRLLLLLLILLVGCQSPALPQPDTAPVDAVAVITIADRVATQSLYTPLIDAFQTQNPDIVVQFVVVPETTVSTRNATQIAETADTAIITLFDPAAVGAFMALQPLMDADMAFDRQDFWPGALDACTVDGQTFGLPVLVEPDFLFYDGAAFAAAGLAPPQPGWTWDDFQQAARVLTEREGSTTTRYGFVPLVSPLDLLGPQVAGALATSADRDTAVTAALASYVALAEDGVVPRTTDTERIAQHKDLITNRQAVMWTDSPINLEQWRTTLGDEVALAVFPSASNNNMESGNPATVSCATISSGSQNPQAAWRWITFLTTQSLRPDWRTVPARPSVADAIQHWERAEDSVRPVLRAALDRTTFRRLSIAEETDLNGALDRVLGAGANLGTEVAQIPFTTQPQAAAPAATPVIVAAPAPTANPDVITIAYYSDFFTNVEVVRRLATQFNQQNPEIQVRVTDFRASSGLDTSHAGLAERFDCFESLGTVSPADQSLMYDLRPILDADATLAVDEFDPVQQRWMSQDGALYALPIAAAPLVIRYNRDVLEAQGIPFPTGNWDAADFEQIALRAASGTGANRVYGFTRQQGDVITFLFALQGVTLYNTTTEPTAARFTDPEVADAAVWIAQLITDGVIPPLNELQNFDRSSALISSGRAAMWLGIAGQQPEVTIESDGSLSASPVTTGIVAPPAVTAPLPLRYPSNFYISRRITDPAPCWEWMKFLTSNPDAVGGVPTRRSVLESPNLEAVLGAEQALAYRAAAAQLTTPTTGAFWLGDAIVEIVDGAEPTVALEKAQQRVETFNACLTAADELSSETESTCISAAESQIP